MPREPKLIVGAKCYYIPRKGAPKASYKNGMIKALSKDPGSIFVVFNCNDDWKNFKDYTGQLTDIKQLRYGWIKHT